MGAASTGLSNFPCLVTAPSSFADPLRKLWYSSSQRPLRDGGIQLVESSSSLAQQCPVGELQLEEVEQQPETPPESSSSPSIQHPPDFPTPYARVGSETSPPAEESSDDHAIIDIEPAPSQPSTPAATLGKTVLSLTFQAALGLMVFSFQGSSSSSSSSYSFTEMQTRTLHVVEVALTLGFTSAWIGLFMRSAYPRIATLIEHASSFSAAVTFFGITAMFISDTVRWLLWPAGILVLLAFIRTISLQYGLTHHQYSA